MEIRQQPIGKGQAGEVVGLFQSADAVEAAVSALTSAGWDRADLSLLAQKTVLTGSQPVAETLQAADDPAAERGTVVSGTDVRQGRTLAASTAGIIAAFVASGATIMTGGTALAAIIGAAAAGGGATAAVEALGKWAGAHRAQFLQEQIDQGGILLWVMLKTPAQEKDASEILIRHGARMVHSHDMPEAAAHG